MRIFLNTINSRSIFFIVVFFFLINGVPVSAFPPPGGEKPVLSTDDDDATLINAPQIKKGTENFLYQSIEHLNKTELLSLIDSLLDAETIDKSLIEELNQYIQTQYHCPALKDTSDAIFSSYPSHQYYYNWDTKKVHAYSKELSSSDTTILLVLKDFYLPVKGVITSTFGYRNSRHHNGVDIDLRSGTPVSSAFEGMVRIAEWHGCYGNIVIIRHYNGLETFYAHLSKIKVKTGEIIEAGQVLGLGGNTGRSRGSHLHFETRFKGIPINPKFFISFHEDKLQSDSVLLKKARNSYIVSVKGSGFHTVKKGESLYIITRKYGIETRRICELNGISIKTLLKIGQKLRIS